MNTDYQSYAEAARRSRSHAHRLVTHGSGQLANDRPHGSHAGVVCLLCWDYAASVDRLHHGYVGHRVPGVPLDEDVVGCCPDHDVRPRHTLAVSTAGLAPCSVGEAVADGGARE